MKMMTYRYSWKDGYKTFRNIHTLPAGFFVEVKDDFIKNFAHQFKNIFSMRDTSSEGYDIGSCLFTAMCVGRTFYHTPYHVMNIFHTADSMGIALNADERLAIWFHDAIYRAGSKENETQSVLFMESLLHYISDVNIMCGAKLIIEDTARHLDDKPVYSHSSRMMDLDMAGFAADEESFAIQNDCIEKEFLENGYSFVDVIRGRINFLEALQSKDKIYRTEQFIDTMEKRARENISMLIDQTKRRIPSF
jgi:predicted metal-dependent HD superfamily phosphohydrolase